MKFMSNKSFIDVFLKRLPTDLYSSLPSIEIRYLQLLLVNNWNLFLCNTIENFQMIPSITGYNVKK